MDQDDTLAATDVPTAAPALRSVALGDGYSLGAVLGRGGMGEVVAAHDRRIGRDVAIKRMRDAGDIARFLREAKIQARLDHPAIVPVYELGRDEDNQPYFTMKRLAGKTLGVALADTSQQRLLRAVVDVARAIALAHARGVVHRDLKPSNIMLGDFGEVYVIDWGVARELGAPETISDDDPTIDEGATAVGSLLGTPGYMSPEQARGEPDVGPPTDVYALGAILFEILAGVALHPPGRAALESTLAGGDMSPARRALDRAIAPELDVLCVAALAFAPAERPTARALADAIEKFLDGDRDVAQRKQLAAVQLARALAAFTADDRAGAMQSAGRALALDPQSDAAAQLVTSLMLEPPKVMPAELEALLAERDRGFVQHQWRLVTAAFVTFFVFFPVLWLQGIKDWTQFGVLYAIIGALTFQSWRFARGARPQLSLAMLLNVMALLLMSRWVGPWMLMPGILCIEVTSFVSYPENLRRQWIPIAVMAVAAVMPTALEALGAIAPTSRVVGDAVVTTSNVLDLGGAFTPILLTAGTVAITIVCGLFAGGLARGRNAAQRKLEIQSWHLRKLLPV